LQESRQPFTSLRGALRKLRARYMGKISVKVKMGSDSSKIESDGITCLRNFISQSPILKLMSREGDKYPSWDGEIIIYNQPNNDLKNNIYGRVPIQVKSANRQWKEKETRSIEVSDLTNYYHDGGVVLLRPVFIDTVHYQIFGIILLTTHIYKYINSATTKSVSIELDKIENIGQLEGLLKYFFENRKLQFYYDNDKESKYLKDGVNEFVINSFGAPFFPKSLFSRSSCIYIKGEHDLIPTALEIRSLQASAFISIKSIDDIVFKNTTIKYDRSGKAQITLNSVLQLLYEDKKYHFNININKDSKIIDIPIAFNFIESVIKNKCFYIDNKMFSFNVKNNNSYRKNIRDYWQNTVDLIKGFRIDPNNTTVDSLNEYKNNINLLIHVLIDKKPVNIDNTTDTLIVKTYDILNKKIIIMFSKEENNLYYGIDYIAIDSYFVEIVNNDKAIRCSRFIALETIFINNLSDYISCINGYEDDVIDDLIKYYNKELNDFYLYFALDCIKGYDNTLLSNGLNIATKIIEIISNSNIDEMTKNILIINQYQILYRKNELSKEHEDILKTILKYYKDNIDLQCCIYILLKDYDNFEIEFNKQTQEKQEEFKNWPIWNLYKKQAI